jgi:subtilisin-like proprotein convertase family protein
MRDQHTKGLRDQKPHRWVCWALLFCSIGFFTASPARAGIYDFSFTMPNGGVPIPDGNPSGFANTVNLGSLDGIIQSITLTINVSGGYNGDLYAYISHGSGMSVLLNRVGTGPGDSFGYGDTGFNVTFSGAGAHDIHNYQDFSPTFNGSGQLTGTWRPDNSGGNGNLGVFNGLDPNGNWTIFFADLSSGEQSTLLSWTLEIDTVPEPITCALGLFLTVFIGVRLIRSRKKNSAL